MNHALVATTTANPNVLVTISLPFRRTNDHAPVGRMRQGSNGLRENGVINQRTVL
jgi:hypothetical protein